MPLSISWISVFFALLLSSGVGVLFGYWLANATAQLNPVDALRVDLRVAVIARDRAMRILEEHCQSSRKYFGQMPNAKC